MKIRQTGRKIQDSVQKYSKNQKMDEDGREQKLSAFVRLVYEYLPSMIIFAVNFFSAQIWYFFQDKNFERFEQSECAVAPALYHQVFECFLLFYDALLGV